MIQNYDPLHQPILSTIVAAFPIVLLLVMIASGRIKTHWAALIALAATFLVAVLMYGMPLPMAVKGTILGLVGGFFPIGWIIVNVLFLYRMTVDKGHFAVFQHSMGSVTSDRRMQLLLIAFCFGAFFEGAAGFGTPVAVSAAMLMGLGFSPLAAAAMSLMADTATVAFGALGAPIQGLSAATGIDPFVLGQAIGRQSSVFSMIIPFYMIWMFCGFKKMWDVWPAILVAASAFTLPQFLISNYSNPYIVDVAAGGISLAALVLFLRIWKPREIMTNTALRVADTSQSEIQPNPPLGALPTTQQAITAWVPWVILCLVLIFWATDYWKHLAAGIFSPVFHVPGLDKQIIEMPPVVAKATPLAGAFNFSFLTYSGTGILVSALIAGAFMGCSPGYMLKSYGRNLRIVTPSIVTITAMLALGTLTNLSGADGTLGLAFARTGFFFPFFGTILGWLGVAATGSDTSSNVLFGALQVITAHQLDISPILMAAANSTGGVMGKIIAISSIVVAATATGWHGGEGKILRYVFWSAVFLGVLVGLLVMLQAYVWPFTLTVPAG
ncbi:MAG TPA: L-lactate permease [Rhizomicrobium sp.]|nr:L-lactate permease [Rhizomicrobium sp.]